MKNSNKTVKYQSGNLILKAIQQLGPLVLGDCNSAMDKKIHKEYNLQTIISIGQQAMPIKQKLPQNCKHYFYDVHDNKSQKIPSQLFDQINKIIDQRRKYGGVLVHCYAGVSRSSSFVIAYVMYKFHKNYDTAKDEVKTARNCIYPNDGFVHQLKSYWKVLENREEQRLRKIEEEKRLLIENSIVKSARKSIRGAVRGADMSPQKVRQMAQQSKKTTHEIIIEPVQIQKQSIQMKKEEIDFQRSKTSSILELKQKLNEKRLYSMSMLANRSKVRSKKTEQIKLPNVYQKSFLDKTKEDAKAVKTLKNHSKTETKKVELKQPANIKQSINVPLKSQTSTSSRYPREKMAEERFSSLMKESKSVLSAKKQKSTVLFDQNLLNDHEKKVKKIYETKIVVK